MTSLYGDTMRGARKFMWGVRAHARGDLHVARRLKTSLGGVVAVIKSS